MKNKIYWYCFKRQCREFYELLSAYKLISCSLDEFMSHFTGKKFYDEDVLTGEKMVWYGDEKMLNETVIYLAEKGFIDKDTASTKAMEEHFIFAGKPIAKGESFIISLKDLFPETTGYRCKTRLFYKERNKKPLKIINMFQENI